MQPKQSFSPTSLEAWLPREISFYGGEEALLSPDDLVGRKDAEQAADHASKTYELVKKLLQL
ncbi:MAG: hypothetical protein QXM16_01995 [Nitrososphaerota archaeon]